MDIEMRADETFTIGFFGPGDGGWVDGYISGMVTDLEELLARLKK